MGTHRFMRFTTVGFVLAVAAILSVTSVSPAAAQFGAIRDAARRAAEEAKKAEEAKRKAEEAKKTSEDATKKRDPSASQPAAAPAAPAATSQHAAAAAPAPAAAGGAAPAPAFETFSKFDFVPGEKIVAMEDFTQDAIGDLPAKWNTNASGEIVTIVGQPGRWLKMTKAGVFTPEFVTDLPENVTVEFDPRRPPRLQCGIPIRGRTRPAPQCEERHRLGERREHCHRDGVPRLCRQHVSRDLHYQDAS